MATRKKAAPKKAVPKKTGSKKSARKLGESLNFINDSNDKNNSQVVIFEGDTPPPKSKPKTKSKAQPGRGAR